MPQGNIGALPQNATAWYDYAINPGNAYQTQYMGPDTDTPHYAYDIETPFHTPLTAPLSGTVVQADYAAWGGEIFIQPDNKNLPEYYFYHPDEVDVSKGEHVNAGDFIGLSGGENPGYPGAEHPASPAYSTGPHTHIGWFTKWVTPSQTGETIPFGPDTSTLIEYAKGEPVTSSAMGNLSNVASSGSTSSQPSSILQWFTDFQQNASGYLVRIGVGLIGVVLIGGGTLEIVSALKGETPQETLQSVGGSVAKVAEVAAV